MSIQPPPLPALASAHGTEIQQEAMHYGSADEVRAVLNYLKKINPDSRGGHSFYMDLEQQLSVQKFGSKPPSFDEADNPEEKIAAAIKQILERDKMSAFEFTQNKRIHAGDVYDMIAAEVMINWLNEQEPPLVRDQLNHYRAMDAANSAIADILHERKLSGTQYAIELQEPEALDNLRKLCKKAWARQRIAVVDQRDINEIRTLLDAPSPYTEGRTLIEELAGQARIQLSRLQPPVKPTTPQKPVTVEALKAAIDNAIGDAVVLQRVIKGESVEPTEGELSSLDPHTIYRAAAVNLMADYLSKSRGFLKGHEDSPRVRHFAAKALLERMDTHENGSALLGKFEDKKAYRALNEQLEWVMQRDNDHLLSLSH